jgi:hypothetical protein
LSIQLESSVHLPTLDRHSALPLYYQIQQHLLEQIRAGTLKPREANTFGTGNFRPSADQPHDCPASVEITL